MNIRNPAIRCQICEGQLKTKSPEIYGKDPLHISRHHLFPKRFTQYFSDTNELIKEFQIKTFSTTGIFCYECHEEILHNIIINEEMINGLSIALRGKNKKTKIKLLHQMFKKGIETYVKTCK